MQHRQKQKTAARGNRRPLMPRMPRPIRRCRRQSQTAEDQKRMPKHAAQIPQRPNAISPRKRRQSLAQNKKSKRHHKQRAKISLAAAQNPIQPHAHSHHQIQVPQRRAMPGRRRAKSNRPSRNLHPAQTKTKAQSQTQNGSMKPRAGSPMLLKPVQPPPAAIWARIPSLAMNHAPAILTTSNKFHAAIVKPTQHGVQFGRFPLPPRERADAQPYRARGEGKRASSLWALSLLIGRLSFFRCPFPIIHENAPSNF